MKDREWTLRGRRVVTPSGVVAADVLIRNELIAAIGPHDGPDSEGVVLDAGDLAVLPGLVAIHRDGRERGRLGVDRYRATTEDARAGGVTTLIDLPLDGSPGANSAEAFLDRVVAAEASVRVDSGLVAGLGMGSPRPVAPWIEAGAVGVEAFLGMLEPGTSRASAESDLRSAMAELVKLGRPLLVHSARVGWPDVDPGGALAASLPGAEYDAIRLLIRLCRETRCPVVLIQPSAVEALPMIAEARAERLPISVATGPRHLAEVARAVVAPGGPASDFGRRPGADPRDRLREALASGLVEAIATDLPPDLGGGPEVVGPDAGAGAGAEPLRTMLSAAWAWARAGGSTLDQLAGWMARRPAELFGLANRKGAIAIGYDADFVVFDPDAPADAGDEPDLPRNNLEGTRPDAPIGRLGRVEATVLRGNLIAVPGRSFHHPSGAIVLRLEETEPMPRPPR